MSSFPAEQPLLQTATAAGWDPYRIRDVLLAVLAFAAGSIDVLSWLALGKVFCAFMTGNAVFLAAGLFSTSPTCPCTRRWPCPRSARARGRQPG